MRATRGSVWRCIFSGAVSDELKLRRTKTDEPTPKIDTNSSRLSHVQFIAAYYLLFYIFEVKSLTTRKNNLLYYFQYQEYTLYSLINNSACVSTRGFFGLGGI